MYCIFSNNLYKLYLYKLYKYILLYINKYFLLGRHKCDCEAKRHAFVNNCLNCGRIICKQENVGPCFFCGELVCYPDQQVILQNNTKQAENLYNKLMEQKPSKSLENSLKQRDKLLEFDRNRFVLAYQNSFLHFNNEIKFVVLVALK